MTIMLRKKIKLKQVTQVIELERDIKTVFITIPYAQETRRKIEMLNRSVIDRSIDLSIYLSIQIAPPEMESTVSEVKNTLMRIMD